MTELSEAQWQAFAKLKPALKPQVAVVSQQFRNQPWPLLQDNLSQKNYRLSSDAFTVVQRLDGRVALGQLVSPRMPKEALMQLTLSLYRLDLLAGEFPVLAEDLALRARPKPWARWLSPLAQKVSLANPRRWLDRLYPLVKPALSGPGCWLLLGLMLGALLLAMANSSALMLHWHSRFLDPANLLWLPLVYLVMKLLHELGHALAVRHFSGDCREIGVMFLALIPLPYTDASDSVTFAKHQRLWVAGAGILVELLLGAVALIAWVSLSPGWGRDIAFDVVMIAVFSSLLFNANPLMRFDGYYLLTDAIEVPDLAQRSNAYWHYAWQRYGLGLDGIDNPAWLAGEKPWLIGYAPLAFLYRVTVLMLVASFLSNLWYWAGLALVLWALAGQWFYPAVMGVANSWQKARVQRKLARWASVYALTAATVYGGLFALPVADSTYAQGLVRLPNYTVYAGADAFVDAVLVQHGDQVQAGQPLVRLRNDELPIRQRLLYAKREEHQKRRQAALVREPGIVKAESLALALVEAEIRELEQKLSALTLVAPHDGRVVITDAASLMGRWLTEGTPLLQVFDERDVQVQVWVNQRDMVSVTDATKAVWVKTEFAPGEVYQAKLDRVVPKAHKDLPSASLASAYGGAITMDARDQRGLTAQEHWLEIELLVPQQLLQQAIPHRLHVRFDHGGSPLAQQWWRGLNRWWHSASRAG